MDAIDGVSKVFLVYHDRGAMHFYGSENERELALRLLRRGKTSSALPAPLEHIAWLESVKKEIDEIVIDIKKNYEIDGYKHEQEEPE